MGESLLRSPQPTVDPISPTSMKPLFTDVQPGHETRRMSPSPEPRWPHGRYQAAEAKSPEVSRGRSRPPSERQAERLDGAGADESIR
jgi:hypothetical protein